MMITLTREEVQQVLECMETAIKAGDWVVDGACDPDFILYMLRTRLAQPERKWQELSDYDVDNIVKASSGRESAVYLAEAKLKEKNS
jgi:hypothetical protein